MNIAFRSKVWIYSGFAGWHFVTVNKSITAKIKKQLTAPRRGFGSLRVTARIGKTEWKTSIFPTKEGTFLLAIKKQVRQKEMIAAGDLTSVRLTLLLQ